MSKINADVFPLRSFKLRSSRTKYNFGLKLRSYLEIFKMYKIRVSRLIRDIKRKINRTAEAVIQLHYINPTKYLDHT